MIDGMNQRGEFTSDLIAKSIALGEWWRRRWRMLCSATELYSRRLGMLLEEGLGETFAGIEYPMPIFQPVTHMGSLNWKYVKTPYYIRGSSECDQLEPSRGPR